MAVALGYEFLAEDAWMLGRWKEGLEWAEEDRRIGERIGSQDRVGWAEYARADLLHGRAELRDAAAAGRNAVALAEKLEEVRLALLAMSTLAKIETDLGSDGTARGLAERAIAQAETIGLYGLKVESRGALAYWHLARGEWDSAAALYGECVVLRAGTDSRMSGQLMLGPYHAEACLAQGKVDEAEKVLAESLEVARDSGSRHAVALGRRVEGQILAARAARTEARVAFDDAVETLEEIGSRLELGRALDHRGRFHLAEGDHERGRADLDRAQEIFAAAGAVRDRDRAREALRKSD
jgi:tetratricopeptide (TPR) repeat protein